MSGTQMVSNVPGLLRQASPDQEGASGHPPEGLAESCVADPGAAKGHAPDICGGALQGHPDCCDRSHGTRTAVASAQDLAGGRTTCK